MFVDFFFTDGLNSTVAKICREFFGFGAKNRFLFGWLVGCDLILLLLMYITQKNKSSPCNLFGFFISIWPRWSDANVFVPQLYQFQRGISGGPALKHFYVIHRGGQMGNLNFFLNPQRPSRSCSTEKSRRVKYVKKMTNKIIGHPSSVK